MRQQFFDQLVYLALVAGMQVKERSPGVSHAATAVMVAPKLASYPLKSSHVGVQKPVHDRRHRVVATQVQGTKSKGLSLARRLGHPFLRNFPEGPGGR